MPHIHGFNKHTDIEEDTNKDKPSYQFGGHNGIDFVEDTLPSSGQNRSQQTIGRPQQHHRHQKYQASRKQAPPTPEVPSEPETPAPPTPEVPSEPETPTPPAEPGKPATRKEEPKKPSKPVEQGKVVTPVIEINEKVKAVVPTKQNNLRNLNYLKQVEKNQQTKVCCSADYSAF